MKEATKSYNYTDAGYNGFFRRTLASTPTETNLKNVGANRTYRPNELNFDGLQTSGSLGDVLRVGPQIEIDGREVKVAIKDGENNEIGRFGLMGD